jgi:hypothetical protein
MGARVRSGPEAGSVPIDLVLVLVVVAAIVAAGVWYTAKSGGPGWIVIVGGFAVLAFVWTFARRIRRRDEGFVEGQRKVGHDDSWTSNKEEE